jgi:uncharacterized membrane protein
MDRLARGRFTEAMTNTLSARRRPMIDSYSRVLTIVTALGAGLNAGVFFAFSSFVMAGLRRLPAAQSISAMNAINKMAPTAWFMTAFVGTAIAGVVLAVSAFRRLGQPSSVYQLAGVALYLVAFVVTAAYHVPRNDALALVDPNAAGAAQTWAHYYSGWMAWNHVRTLAALAGAACLTLSLRAD